MIVVIGSINLDLVANVERLPAPGETVAGSHFITAAGGKGANQALASSRAGGAVKLIGAVGDDAFKQQALELLAASDTDLTGIETVAGATGTASIMVDRDGQNIIAVIPGANACVTPRFVDDAALAEGDIVVLQHEIPQETIVRALDACKHAKAISILNTAPYRAESASLLAQADYVIANETEFDIYAAQLSLAGETREDRIAAYASDHGNTLIVTLGAAGVIAVQGDYQVEIPAPSIVPVDTTGAGDTFSGYFAASLSAGSSLDDALARAVRAGSVACTKPGAQPAIPLASEIDGQ